MSSSPPSTASSSSLTSSWPCPQNPRLVIRPLHVPTDWDKVVWPFILQPILQAGDTYPYPTDTTSEQALQIWVKAPRQTFVAVLQQDGDDGGTNSDGTILGTYYIKPNQPGQGAHVCNCGYATAPAARGQGVASAMCQHSQRVAAQVYGYTAMQFNLVVASNTGAYRLWQRHGYDTLGTIPRAFGHPTLGYVDAYIMYKDLRPLMASADSNHVEADTSS